MQSIQFSAMTPRRALHHCRSNGFSLVELLVSLAITMVITLAAGLVYINLKDSDTKLSVMTDSIETGTFALQLFTRDINQAGSHPTVLPPPSGPYPEGLRLQPYPPSRPFNSDTGKGFITWREDLPPTAYQYAVYGCDGGKFDSITATCVASSKLAPYRSAPDSLVINYFTGESQDIRIVGNRRDCTGSDAGKDAVNATRKLNGPAAASVFNTEDPKLPPHLPLFVSNRYAISPVTTIVEGASVVTASLACNGNGSSGSLTTDPNTTSIYQPMLLGVEDMQITYGVANLDAATGVLSLAPERFYTATEVNAMSIVKGIDGIIDPIAGEGGWSRVVSVRVCLMTRTLGGHARNTDNGSTARTYLDCTDDTPQSYGSGDTSVRTRHVQVIAVRSRLGHTY
jgi:type IV pilus assembly protein PilW